MLDLPSFVLSCTSRLSSSVFRLPSFSALTDAVAAVVIAPVCAACKAPLDYPTRGAVCDECWAAATPLTPFGRDALPPLIEHAAAIGAYDGRLRDIVQALKYDRRPTIARHLAARMRWAGAEVLAGADAVVPVPLHRSRQRERGFNQAHEHARHLGIPVLDALIRTRRTESQADLPAARRRANVRGAFAMSRGPRRSGRGIHGVRGLVLVLIDDVTTTGATLNACADVLVAAGAEDVRALVAARAALKVTAGVPQR